MQTNFTTDYMMLCCVRHSVPSLGVCVLAMIYVPQCVLCQGVGRSSARWTIKTHPTGKLSHVFAVVAGAEEPPSPCSSPRSPSSADSQYHLSNYLDNWI